MSGPATQFDCGLCGARFTHEGRDCSACPLSMGCEVVCCPSCGYTFPRGSHVVDWLTSMWKRIGG